jgi:hypothetical protein
LAEEIKARLGANALDDLPGDVTASGNVQEADLDGDIDGDDSDVALTDVIRISLGDGLATPARSGLDVATAGEDEDSGRLAAANEEDDIWSYNDQGRKWSEVGMAGEKETESGDEENDSEA